MDNKGWGLREMIGLCAILIGALLIVVILVVTNFFGLLEPKNINGSQIDQTRTYNSMELQIIDASKKYIKKLDSNEPLDDYPLYISVKFLQDEKLLDNLYDIKDDGIECSGYIKISKMEDFRYEPYMKCGKNYTTLEYNSKFDE